MEKGLKNLNQAYRSAQKKQGTYEEGDSGIGHSDLDEEHDHDDRMPMPSSSTLSNIPEAFHYRPAYQQTHQRVPSIQNMLQHPGPAYSHQ